MRVISVKTMKKIESNNFKNKNSFFFMKKAGQGCAKEILKINKSKNFLIYCGPGNNGGDGFIIGHELINKGYQVRIISTTHISQYSGDALKALKRLNIRIDENTNSKINKNELIIDCIFGFGLNRNIKKKYKDLFKRINKSKNKVIAVDFPSGINGETGQPMKQAIKADYTLAIHSKKFGHILNEGKEYAGVVRVVKIGLIESVKKNYCYENCPRLWLKKFPKKLKTSHKYTRGKLYIFGGDEDTAGASILSAMSALKVGTGSVTILGNKKIIKLAQIIFPSSLKINCESFEQFVNILKKFRITNFLIGPGAGLNKKIFDITCFALKKIKYVTLDGDSLSVFKNKPKKLFLLLNKNKILTPHEGEFKNIFPRISLKNKLKATSLASKISDSIIVLKGYNTIIAAPNGDVCINTNSTPELATIGSGDVLSGIISSLVGDSKMKPFQAACAGVWLHSEAAKKFGKGLIAEDIIKNIPPVLNKIL